MWVFIDHIHATSPKDAAFLFQKIALPSGHLENPVSSRTRIIPSETRKDDEGVYEEYTPRRTDAVAAGIMRAQ